MNMLTVKDLGKQHGNLATEEILRSRCMELILSQRSTQTALPTDISSLQLPAPPNAPHPLQLAFMVSTQVQLPGHLTVPIPAEASLHGKYPTIRSSYCTIPAEASLHGKYPSTTTSSSYCPIPAEASLHGKYIIQLPA